MMTEKCPTTIDVYDILTIVPTSEFSVVFEFEEDNTIGVQEVEWIGTATVKTIRTGSPPNAVISTLHSVVALELCDGSLSIIEELSNYCGLCRRDASDNEIRGLVSPQFRNFPIVRGKRE